MYPFRFAVFAITIPTSRVYLLPEEFSVPSNSVYNEIEVSGAFGILFLGKDEYPVASHFKFTQLSCDFFPEYWIADGSPRRTVLVPEGSSSKYFSRFEVNK
jgi:hypothetical protein